MTDNTNPALLGLGSMGSAFARAGLAAGLRPTVWNRTPARAEPLLAAGATAAASPAEAVAAHRLVVLCLLDDASVAEVLAGADLTGRDLVNLTTSTPEQARARATWANERGARYLDGGIMAVPPMVGVPGSGAFTFYSGSGALFAEHEAVLGHPAGTLYVGEDPGHAALHDVALLSAMYGQFAGITHAFALIREEAVAPAEFAPLLVGWLTAMASSALATAAHLDSGDYTRDVTSPLAMQVAGAETLLRTAADQNVSPELLTPYLALMRRRSAGHPAEDLTGLVDLLRR